VLSKKLTFLLHATLVSLLCQYGKTQHPHSVLLVTVLFQILLNNSTCNSILCAQLSIKECWATIPVTNTQTERNLLRQGCSSIVKAVPENPTVDLCFSSFVLMYNKIWNNPRFNITQHKLPDSSTTLISGYKLHES
jgi:hypothetical protein